jgi:hypothetical protein
MFLSKVLGKMSWDSYLNTFALILDTSFLLLEFNKYNPSSCPTSILSLPPHF